METLNFNSIESLKENGFTGFITIEELISDNFIIPKEMGVYLIVRNKTTKPSFLEIGSGGHYKSKNPNISTTLLQQEWVDNTIVMYIGKAGGKDIKATLHSRLKQYLKFGQGENVGHYGGRYIWQLSDSKSLLVCWMPLSHDEPREIELKLVTYFKQQYDGKRPFANLQD